MVPILGNAQFRDLEKHLLQEGTVTELELMERAGQACSSRILGWEAAGLLGVHPTYLVLAGMGNNGGDGLVIARALHQAGRNVRVLVVEHRPLATPANDRMLGLALEANVPMARIRSIGEWVQPFDDEVVVDCILGSGLDRPLDGLVLELVGRINVHPGKVIAIDLPTGIVERIGEGGYGLHVKATHTITFEVPRPWLFFPETGEAAGRWELVPIGMGQGPLQGAGRFADLVSTEDVRSRLRGRPRFAHKGTYGHALLLAGGTGYVGAAVLATRGCARSGAGLITLHAPAAVVAAVNATVPDAMTSTDPGGGHLVQLPRLDNPTAIGMGPGIGLQEATATVLSALFATWKGPLVLDADALHLLAQRSELLARLPPGAVLTPHPKEMDRLLGTAPIDGMDRALRTKSFAIEHQCFVVLKAAHTLIVTPEGGVFFNTTGNSGMAKGGAGDVLTGLLTGLLAQGYPALDACLLATYLHGSAGDRAAADLGPDAMRASDLVEQLPAAWKALRAG